MTDTLICELEEPVAWNLYFLREKFKFNKLNIVYLTPREIELVNSLTKEGFIKEETTIGLFDFTLKGRTLLKIVS
jgi:hypothetical protein